MFLGDDVEHLLRFRTDHQQKAVESTLLEDPDLAIDRRHRIDFEADLSHVASSHSGSLAGCQNHDDGLVCDPFGILHLACPSG
jgi:hypothetical protein